MSRLDVPASQIHTFDMALRLGYTYTLEEFNLTLGTK